MNELENLLALQDDPVLGTISTTEGLRRRLATCPEVTALRAAIESNAVTYEDLDIFVRGLFDEFTRRVKFQGDIVIAAIAIAVEFIPDPRFEEFLEDLGRVHIAEMPLSPRIARIVLTERTRNFAQLTTRELVIANELPEGPLREERPRRVNVGETVGVLVLQEV